MSQGVRTGRTCSRVSCRTLASSTLTYIYAEQVALLGPIATFSEPHSYDLCEKHAARMTVPNGWKVIRQQPDAEVAGPSSDDLMAIADAVREVAAFHAQEVQSTSKNSHLNPASAQAALGRRGHLRAVPD